MENNTKLTKESYKNFLRRHSKVSFVIIRVCYVFLLALGLLSLVLYILGETKELGYSIYCLVMGIVFVLYDIFFIKINLALVKDKNLIDSDYNYFLNNDALQIEIKKGDNILAKSSLNYNMIYKIKVYDDCIYIYLNRVNAYILDKNGFKDKEDYQKTLQILAPYFENNKKK